MNRNTVQIQEGGTLFQLMKEVKWEQENFYRKQKLQKYRVHLLSIHTNYSVSLIYKLPSL